jgi:D-alanyl-D-alanine carboxypeptidase (penicillin-binding protein 5/6)
VYTVSAHDVAETAVLDKKGAITIPVKLGEQLSEFQLLQGALVRSANNFAEMAVELTNNGPRTFARLMTQRASQLGARSTTYTDVTGIDSGNMSTATDQIIVARVLEADEVLASVVAYSTDHVAPHAAAR